jgi:hypothetical protein
MIDIIIIGVLVLVIGGAVFYIVKEKKKGAKCIGCPAAGNCPSRNVGKTTCNCKGQTDTKA